ncbi:MAG: GGDEF domain-containing protein [Actinomycetota bacterium]
MVQEGFWARVSGLGYQRARQLLLAAGLAVLLVTAAVMYVRRVETVEVLATLLFIPVFVACVFWNVRGGVIAAVLAAIAYAALRAPAIDAVGVERFGGLLLSRSVAFLAFGAIGGWANQQLQSSLTKLELYDQIDDYTGLFNARFFVQDTDLEVSRSRRYQTIFSISLVDFPVAPLQTLTRRQRQTIRKELGRMLQDAVRTVDRAVHGFDGTIHRFACVLPETGVEGARIFTERLADRLHQYLVQRGVSIERDRVGATSITYPDDGDEAIQALRRTFAEIDRVEHPEAATGQSTTPPAPA